MNGLRVVGGIEAGGDGVETYPLPLGASIDGAFYFPFYHRRFQRSELVAKRALQEVGAALILWSCAMDEDPPGTLPDDDAMFRHMLGAHGGRWDEVRRGALHSMRLYRCLSAAGLERLRAGQDPGEAGVMRWSSPTLASVAEKMAASRDRKADSKEAEAEAKRLERLPETMRAAGASATLVADPQFRAQMVDELMRRGGYWTRSRVRAAMEAVSLRI